ncbi:uncharacterized protein FFM5_11623 [Fusarium fujikuroi]|nr:uncharacterized protein FFM5_11623 [Fusarium fujikuroi]
MPLKTNTDILPEMSDPGRQDISMSSGHTPSATQLRNSQSESPTGIPPAHDLSPDHSQQVHNALSATSNQDTIVVDQDTDEGKITVALDAEVDEII